MENAEDDEKLPEWMEHPAGRACLDRNFDELRKLGREGITIDDIIEDDQDSHLHRACDSGDTELVAVLLEIGCPNCLNRFNYVARTPLAMAAWKGHVEPVRLLIAAGADLDANDESKIGDTALADACEGEYVEIAHLLLDAGANPSIKGWMGMSAIDRMREAIRKTETGESRPTTVEVMDALPGLIASKGLPVPDFITGMANDEFLKNIARQIEKKRPNVALNELKFLLHRMQSRVPPGETPKVM